jgi:hypothetical protein
VSVAIEILNGIKKSLAHLSTIGKHAIAEDHTTQSSVKPASLFSLNEQHEALIAKRKNELMLRLFSAQQSPVARHRPVIYGEFSVENHTYEPQRVPPRVEYIVACKRSAEKIPTGLKTFKFDAFFE